MKIHAAIALAALLALPGCVNLDPAPDNARFYTLTPLAGSTQPESGIAVGLRDVELPEWLDSPKIAVRVSPTEASYSEKHRWAESLERGFAKTVAAGIESAPGVRRARAAPWSGDERFDWKADVRVSRFEGDASGAASLEARFDILSPDGRIAYSGSVSLSAPWNGSDYAALAAELSRFARTLGETIGAKATEAQP